MAARVQGTRRIGPSRMRFSDPHGYDRMLRRAYDDVIAGSDRPDVAPSLIASWRRSMDSGIAPDQHSPHHVRERSEALAYRTDHPLALVLPALRTLLADEGRDGRHLLIVTNAPGEVLWRVGSTRALRQADTLEFEEGADWSEAGIGTNAISQALVTAKPTQLFSAEHLVRTHHDWTCTAAPIKDPRTGKILGVLDVSGPLDTLTSDTLRMVRCGVALAEELLAAHGPDSPDAAPAARPSDSRPSSPHAEVTPRHTPAPQAPRCPASSLHLLGETPMAHFTDGGSVPLSLRRAEILALLCSREAGFSADELAYELHGDTGTPAGIRIEMHRLRSALGPVFESNPYRLAAGLADGSDVGRVRALLRDGRTVDALGAYTAPMLPRSANLTIQLLRTELDSAIGASVRASDDPVLMLRWLDTDMGAADVDAVRELERILGPGDPRYLAARARADRLEQALLTQ